MITFISRTFRPQMRSLLQRRFSRRWNWILNWFDDWEECCAVFIYTQDLDLETLLRSEWQNVESGLIWDSFDVSFLLRTDVKAENHTLLSCHISYWSCFTVYEFCMASRYSNSTWSGQWKNFEICWALQKIHGIPHLNSVYSELPGRVARFVLKLQNGE